MKNDGGSAFPVHPGITCDGQCGMTLRQLYKVAATQGLAIHLNVMVPNNDDMKHAVELACKIADALIAEDELAAREGKDEN